MDAASFHCFVSRTSCYGQLSNTDPSPFPKDTKLTINASITQLPLLCGHLTLPVYYGSLVVFTFLSSPSDELQYSLPRVKIIAYNRQFLRTHQLTRSLPPRCTPLNITLNSAMSQQLFMENPNHCVLVQS